MPGNLKILTLLVLSLAALGGCASTPQASPQRDAEAKQFRAHPATSAIYVYRTDRHAEESGTDLYVDGRLIGATLQQSFFRIDVNPGMHVLNGMGPDQGSLRMETRPGQVYFVELNVIAGNSHFAVVAPQVARQAIISCCELMENWAPGQRPLLR
ncbi:MAG: DUF2846 domain-containing protein [Burkholderiales bacterium]|nr:DUF2846 domain-containing protein [Burkholderiales bacterium]